MANKNKNSDHQQNSHQAKTNRFAEQLKKNLEQKNKTVLRKDVTEDDIKKMEEDELSKQEHVKNKKLNIENEVYSVDINYKKKVLDWKEILIRMGLGFLIGVSSVVPTNATTGLVALTKRFDEIIYNFRDVFKPKNVRQWGLTLLWVLPLLLTWFGIFILTYYVIYKISEVGFGPAIMIGFSGFSILSIPIFFLITKPPFLKNIHELGKNAQEFKPKLMIILLVVGFLLTLLLGFVSRFAWHDSSVSAIVGGLSLQAFDPSIVSYLPPHPSGSIPFNEFKNTNSFNMTQIALLVLVGSFFAGLVVFLPGISSGLMLSTFGRWTQLNYATQVGFASNLEGTKWLQHNNYDLSWSWPIIIVGALGALAGFIVSIFLMTWIKRKWSDQLNSFSLGLMLGGIISVFVAIGPKDYQQLHNDPRVLGCALGLFFGMIIPAGAWFIYLNEKKHINVEKLRFSKYYNKNRARKES